MKPIEVKGKQKFVPSCRFGWSNPRLWLAVKRDTAAARFFRKAFKAFHTQEPRVINVDKNTAYPKAIDELKAKKRVVF